MVNINLKTPPEDFSSVEEAKLSTNGLTVAIKDRNSQSNLHTQLRDTGIDYRLIKSYTERRSGSRKHAKAERHKRNKVKP